MKIISGKQPGPRVTLIHGAHGSGKSTLASTWPSPLFLNVEDGLSDIDCQRTEKLNDFGAAIASISWLAQNPHEFRTAIIDTVDWLERLIWNQTAQDHNVDSIEKVLGGYGKGYTEATKKWEYLIKGLNYLKAEKKLNIVLLSHTKLQKVTPAGQDSFDRYEPDLHKSASSLLQEWADEVLYIDSRIFTRSEELGFNRTRNIALGGKEWVVKTNEAAFCLAKNRLRLPDEMPRDGFYQAYSSYFTKQTSSPALPLPEAGEWINRGPITQPQAAMTAPLPPANISGVVNNGSSKKELAHGQS